MRELTAEALPQVILDHVAACRGHDIAAFMATFATVAFVNDNRREFLGHDAIRAWAEREIFGDNVTLAIASAFQHLDNAIVRFRVDGDFDKTNLPAPLILTYHFTLDDDRIGQLIILHNKPAAS